MDEVDLTQLKLFLGLISPLNRRTLFAFCVSFSAPLDSQECVFIPLPYRNKKAGFGFAADAAENPLSLDVATASAHEHCFAKVGVVSVYLPHKCSAYIHAACSMR